MKAQSLAAVKIGNCHNTKTADVRSPGGRTPEAHAAVIAWHKDHPSAHWCCNPFDLEANTKYKGGFCHTYFGADGGMHMVWVTYRGKIKPVEKSADAEAYDFQSGPRGTKATIEKYGAFAG